jgi:hypothetical protein
MAIRANDDGSYTVQIWTHPRTMKIHTREDCKAMRRLVAEADPVTMRFHDREALRDWFQSECDQRPELSCRWCFPDEPKEIELEQALDPAA